MQVPSDFPLSSCKRLRLSYIVDMPGDEGELSLFEMGEGANDCLDDMRKMGMPDSIMRTIIQQWLNWRSARMMWKG
jgi:hypothetical protein